MKNHSWFEVETVVLSKQTKNSVLPSAPFNGDSIQPLLQNPKFSTPFMIFSRTYIIHLFILIN